MQFLSKIKNFLKFSNQTLLPREEQLLQKVPFEPNETKNQYSHKVIVLPREEEKTEFDKLKNHTPNKISTSKYTYLNCIPKILIEQFSKMANVYFLIIAFFQTIQEISNSGGKPVILFPLFIVVAINGIKNYYEDWKRKKSDDEENSKTVLRYSVNNEVFEAVKWETLEVGDIIKVNENEFFPADCLMITSSEKNGVCYIETKNIDGETNLKFKKSNYNMMRPISNFENIESCLKIYEGLLVESSESNEYIYEFNARISNENDDYFFADYDSFLLRGCSLKQTKFVYAIVIYVGHNTKIMRNSPKSRNKTSRVEYIMNHQIVIVFIVQFVISFTASIISWTQITKLGVDGLNYIVQPIDTEDRISCFSFIITRTGTWIILINNIVPISLLVTLEMVKYIQGMFISWDIHMYDTTHKIAPKVQTSTLNEELGQVKFIFTDKTGTLTKNYMEFKAMSVGGIMYGIDEKSKSFNLKNKLGLNNKINLTDPFGEITNFNFVSSEFGNNINDTKSPNYNNIHLFIQCLSLCHTVITEQTEKLVYHSSSPDETAMVNCARYFNYIFAGRDIYNNVTIKTKTGVETTYKVLSILSYTSERKRMSVIVKTPDDKIRLYAKGADSVINEMIKEDKQMLEKTNSHLIQFAKYGLRTLMIAYRDLSSEEYEKYDESVRYAMNNPVEKEELLDEAYAKVEKDLILLGATGIEDKLQDNVSNVLHSFIDTGIKIWVLTGDKMDTAKSIAFSCTLISHEFFIFEFPEGSTKQEIQKNLLQFSKEYYLSEGEQKKFALIVSLNELNIIMSSKELTNYFYSLAIHCNSVICCRVTPKQKAQMVNLVKNRQPNITTLAIGDGANDVNMITSANIGIGIFGVEGRQAARASDYAIGEFQYLKRLLFVHGRESYRKNSFIVCFNFYKNILYVMPHFFFGFKSFFSGQSLYDPYIYQLYNIVFASFPIIWFGIYDKEVSYDTLMNDHRYYMQGIVGKLFHSLRFWKWILYGILQASFVYFFSFYGDRISSSNGKTEDLWSNGSIAYSGVVIIVNLKILLTTCTHSYISIGLFLLSILSYYVTLYFMSIFPVFSNFGNFIMIISSKGFYLTTACLIMVCVIVDVGSGTLLREFGLVADPLKLRLEEFEEKDEIAPIEMKEINSNNNSFTGAAFAQREGAV